MPAYDAVTKDKEHAVCQTAQLTKENRIESGVINIIY